MKFRVAGGGWVNTGSALGSGGEATIYSVIEDAAFAAKHYSAPSPERAAKLQLMIACQPHDPMASQGHTSICWPMSLLIDPSGVAVGFLMPRIDNAKSRPLFEIWNPKSRRSVASGFTWKHLFRIGSNLSSVVAEIHAKGYVIGDFNESNVLVSDRALVSLVDCDSMQVRDPNDGRIYRCLVGKPEFTAPELVGHSFQNIDRTPDQDLFALAIMLFMLLMEGTHPFSGVWRAAGDPPPIEDRIRIGASPYVDDPKIRVMPGAPPFSNLDSELQDLFKRAFGAGAKDPSTRPDAREWQKILAKKESALTTCHQKRSHLFSKHLSTCPWCEREHHIGSDPFPGTQPLQVPLKQVPLAPQFASPVPIPTTGAVPGGHAPITPTVATAPRPIPAPVYPPSPQFLIASSVVAACLCVSLVIAPYLHAWGTMALTALLSLGINAWLLKASLFTISSIERRILGKLPYAACASLGAIFFSLFPAMIDFAHSMNVWTINPFAALLSLIPFLILIVGFRIIIWPNARRVLNANGNGIGFGALLMSGLIVSFLGFWIVGWALPEAWRNDFAGVQTAPSTNGSSVQAEQQINGMLTGWTGCHISNDAACETTFYAPKVDLYFVHRNVSRAYVLKLLKAALDKGGHLNQYHLENVRIQVLSPSSATVSLEKVWTSVSGADKIHHTQSQLGVVSINGAWLITSEKDISDHVETPPNNQAEAPNPTDETTEGAPLTPDSQTPVANPPQPTDSQTPPVNQVQTATPPPGGGREPHGEPVLDQPVDIAGTLVRIDNRAGQIFYNVTNTSPVPFPRVTKMHFYSDSGRTGTPGGLVAQIPPLEPGQSGQIKLSISYTPQESFAFAGEAFGRTQPNQIFCSALASRFVGYAGVVLETNNFRIKLRFPCQ